MKESPIPLTALTEAQRAQAQSRFAIIRPALEDGISQAQVARTHTIPASTVRGWVKRYRERGLAGLADRRTRSDKGKSRRLPADAITLIEGLALRPPRRSHGLRNELHFCAERFSQARSILQFFVGQGGKNTSAL